MEYEIVDGFYKGPEHWKGNLDLRGTQITSLGNLKSVNGYLDLSDTQIKTLGNLRTVSMALCLVGARSLTSLGNLVSVGGWLTLADTSISSLGNLKSVGGSLSLPDGTLLDHFSAYKKKADRILIGLSLEDYPLYMSHKNLIVRTAVLKGLANGT